MRRASGGRPSDEARRGDKEQNRRGYFDETQEIPPDRSLRQDRDLPVSFTRRRWRRLAGGDSEDDKTPYRILRVS